MPLSVIKMLMAKFIGSENDGVSTSARHIMRNIQGMRMLTFIGRGMSGFECRIQISPKMQAAIESQSA